MCRLVTATTTLNRGAAPTSLKDFLGQIDMSLQDARSNRFMPEDFQVLTLTPTPKLQPLTANPNRNPNPKCPPSITVSTLHPLAHMSLNLRMNLREPDSTWVRLV